MVITSEIESNGGKEDDSADRASRARLARDSQQPAPPPAFCSTHPYSKLFCLPMPVAAPLTTDSTAGQSRSQPVFLSSLCEHSLGSALSPHAGLRTLPEPLILGLTFPNHPGKAPGMFEILTLGNSVCEHRLTFGERTK